MFNLMNLLSGNNPSKLSVKDKEQIATLLKTTPQALEAFENAYKKENLYSPHEEARREPVEITPELQAQLQILKDRIVNELLYETEILIIKNNTVSYAQGNTEKPDPYVSIQDLLKIPEEIRPQLTGDLMTTDLRPDVADSPLMFYYKKYDNAKKAGKTKEAKNFMYRFLQGLDILDLNPIIYECLGMNNNNMSNWLPALAKALDMSKNRFFRIPDTVIVKVPMTVLQMSRIQYQSLNKTTLDIINDWAVKAFNLNPELDYFIKTGTYSSKFDFRNARVTDPQEVLEIGSYLVYIQSEAVMRAGSFDGPAIIGMSTTNEWVVREYIPDPEHNPEIYHGLPLRTEYRIFIDTDTKQVLSIVPYWDPKVMKERFGHMSDKDHPDMVHDYITYTANQDKLMDTYTRNRDKIVSEVQNLLPYINLSGQWSLDIMQSGDEFYLIDMATAHTSAYYESVPKELRNPTEQNWLPDLSKKEIKK